jgi:hypothetical protein
MLGCALFRMQCFGNLEPGDVFVVKIGCHVPIFTTWNTTLPYEIGIVGTNCYKLDTVLWQGAMVRVINRLMNKNIEVEFFLSENARGEGFTHSTFLETAMTQSNDEGWKTAFEKKQRPLSMDEIKKVFQRCVDEKVPYCYGANNFEKIDLKEYEFIATNSSSIRNRPYELRGFDSSGLLHFVSNGNLPHCTYGLDRVGQVIFTFDTRKKHLLEEKRMVLNMLKDTDYITTRLRKNRFNLEESNSVLISFNGGFLEFRNLNDGLVYTKKRDALERLDFLLEEGARKGNDLLVVRWHPELLGEEINW